MKVSAVTRFHHHMPLSTKDLGPFSTPEKEEVHSYKNIEYMNKLKCDSYRLCASCINWQTGKHLMEYNGFIKQKLCGWLHEGSHNQVPA